MSVINDPLEVLKAELDREIVLLERSMQRHSKNLRSWGLVWVGIYYGLVGANAFFAGIAVSSKHPLNAIPSLVAAVIIAGAGVLVTSTISQHGSKRR